MLLISPVWQARLTAVQRVGKLTLWTFVVWPALIFFFLFLLSADKAGSGGQLLLTWAEEAVRGAPAGRHGAVRYIRPARIWLRFRPATASRRHSLL